MRERILVVDDEAGVRESFRMMLSDDYDVTTVKGGTECLELLKKGDMFSLIILDLRMPDLDGMEVLRRTKKINFSLPVVILTAVGTHQTVVEALKLGAEDFIAKPVDVYRVKEVIGKILSRAKEQTTENRLRREVVSADELLKESFAETINVLTEIIELKDPELKRHSTWTAKYAVAIAERLGFSKEQVEIIQQTSLLHDIGKVVISDFVLKKKEELTSKEKETLKKHSEIGERILRHLKLMHIEQTMIRHHHEHYDGTGYPDGLKGEEIPIYARIMAVADAFESMIFGRVYGKALSNQQAIEELKKKSGTQFDPKIVAIFIEIIQD